MNLKKTATWLLDSWTGNFIAAAALVLLAFSGWNLWSRSDDEPIPIDQLTPRLMLGFGLVEQVGLLSPAQFGVGPWRTGDFASYDLSDARREGAFEVAFQVLNEVQPSHAVVEHHGFDPQGLFWLRKEGFPGFRSHPEDTYQVVSRRDLRLQPKLPAFKFQKGYIPLAFKLFKELPLAPSARLEDLGEEEITTPAGTFSTRRMRAHAPFQTIDLWVDPKVSPLGLVKAQTEHQSLLLKSFGHRQAEPELPSMIKPLIDGRSTLSQGCNSCHRKGDFHERTFPPT